MKLIYDRLILESMDIESILNEIKLEMYSHDFDVCKNLSFEIYVSDGCFRLKVYQL